VNARWKIAYRNPERSVMQETAGPATGGLSFETSSTRAFQIRIKVHASPRKDAQFE
jgi:hypothetical protein